MIGRLARAGATVGIAGVLVFAVPVTSEALVNPVPLGQFAIGAVKAAAPVIAGSEVIGPEGALIVTTAVALGALAYATKDTWMPWLAGQFGQGGATNVQNAGSVCYSITPVGPGADPGTMSLTFAAGSGCGSGQAVASSNGYYQCKNLTTGAMSGGPWGPLYGGGFSVYNNNTYANKWSLSCPAGTHMTSWGITATTGAHTSAIGWGAAFSPYNDSTYQVNARCRLADGTLSNLIGVTTNPGSPPAGSEVPGAGGGGLLVPSCAGAFAGSHAEGFTVSGTQTGGTQKELYHQDYPTTSVLYPNCVGAGNYCTYVVTYNGAPCVIGQAECVAWSRSAQANPDPYACLFGIYAVALEACAVDERVYEPGGVVLTKLNTDGNPNTYDAPVPAWAPQPVPSPVAGAPGGAPVPVPGGGTGPLPSPGGTPSTNGDCWSSGSFSWNPIDWVLSPVECALSWAFVPKTATVSTLAATAKADLTTQGIGPMVTAVTANVSKVGGNGAGCAGPSVTFAAVGITKAMTPFNACTTPMSTLASISYAMTTVVVVLGGGFAAVKAVGAGFGFNFSMGKRAEAA